MERVIHLRRLAQTCRNLTRDLPEERAKPLRALAEDYDAAAHKRLLAIENGFLKPVTNLHPSHAR